MAKDEKEQDQDYKARSVALRLLARREHSRHELSLKLRQRQIEAEIIESVLDDYEHEGWLDDDRFADIYARQRMDAGYGPLKILAELQQRGIQHRPDCLADTSDDDWSLRAARLRERRFGLGCLEEDLTEKLRQARFLTRRGYSAAQVERALEAGASDYSEGLDPPG